MTGAVIALACALACMCGVVVVQSRTITRLTRYALSRTPLEAAKAERIEKGTGMFRHNDDGETRQPYPNLPSPGAVA